MIFKKKTESTFFSRYIIVLRRFVSYCIQYTVDFNSHPTGKIQILARWYPSLSSTLTGQRRRHRFVCQNFPFVPSFDSPARIGRKRISRQREEEEEELQRDQTLRRDTMRRSGVLSTVDEINFVYFSMVQVDIGVGFRHKSVILAFCCSADRTASKTWTCVWSESCWEKWMNRRWPEWVSERDRNLLNQPWAIEKGERREKKEVIDAYLHVDLYVLYAAGKWLLSQEKTL